MSRFTSVFVLGVAHCGSTLLGRLLNGHPSIFCGGELLRLNAALEEDLPCSCGESLRACGTWSSRIDRLQAETRGDWRRFEPETFARLGGEFGAQTVLDLSKTLAWRRARRWSEDGVGFVFLLRDSRGVLAATARTGKDLREPIRKHVKWTRRLERFVRRRPDSTLTLRYEDLCSSPAEELRRISDFLGLEYDEAMLRHAENEHHFVHSSRSVYLPRSNEIRLDDRWQRDLDAINREQIERAMDRVPILRDSYLVAMP